MEKLTEEEKKNTAKRQYRISAAELQESNPLYRVFRSYGPWLLRRAKCGPLPPDENGEVFYLVTEWWQWNRPDWRPEIYGDLVH